MRLLALINRMSIKWKIFAYLIGFCVLLLAVLWTFQTVLLENFYKSVKTFEIRRDAEGIGSFVKAADWESLSKTISDRRDLYVEVWTLDSGTIAVTDNYPDGIQARLSQLDKLSLFLEARDTGKSVIKRYFNENSIGLRKTVNESIMYTQLLSTPSESGWLLMVSANISPVTATINTLRIQLYAISGIMLLLSIAIAILISQKVSKPIQQLNKSAAELGKGNYSVSFEGYGYREIMELSDTLTRAADELSQTEALRRELIANVSHDLRTPLTLISGYSEMMRDIPGEGTPENMQVIIDESKRLTSLVNDLLDLSRIQADMSHMNFSVFSITSLIGEIIERISRLSGRDEYIFIFNRSEDVRVNADSERISQVIYNFLTNAMTYTGSDKTVTVNQIVENGRVTIEVCDSGDGIPPESLERVWERYYRAKENHKRAITGTGLGLSIVKSILEKHPDVEYGVSSEPGNGSVFWFTLPQADPVQPAEPDISLRDACNYSDGNK